MKQRTPEGEKFKFVPNRGQKEKKEGVSKDVERRP
jgi:hypothetical protein